MVLRQREFFIGNLLVRTHVIIVMIRWTGLAPWEFEFPFPGSLTSNFHGGAGACGASGSRAGPRWDASELSCDDICVVMMTSVWGVCVIMSACKRLQEVVVERQPLITTRNRCLWCFGKPCWPSQVQGYLEEYDTVRPAPSRLAAQRVLY